MSSPLAAARTAPAAPSSRLAPLACGTRSSCDGLAPVEAAPPALPQAPVIAPKLREVAALVEACR